MRRLLFGTAEQNSPFVATTWLLLRLHVGLSLSISAGLPKVKAFPATDWFVEQVAEMGFPAAGFWAFVAAWTEVIGGFLIALGLTTRLAAFLLTLHFAVAAFVFHKSFPLVDLQIAQLFMWSLAALAAVGGGRFSLDRLMERRLDRP